MYASGQWYFTAIWEKYHSLLSRESYSAHSNSEAKLAPLHHILMDMRPGSDPWVFFTQVQGNSWAHWDNRMFSFIGDHVFFLLILFSGLLFSVGWACMRSYSHRFEEKAHKQSAA